jgi:hypothetical protein
MKTAMRLAAPFLVAAIAACGSHPLPPGYDGELPSPAARRSLGALAGAHLAVAAGEIPAGEYRVGTFAVVPNPIAGKSGGVMLAADAERAFLPLLRDADVADLHRRVGAALPAEIAVAARGEVSAAYARALGD